MIGHRAVIGLSLLSALLFSAIAAQSALAIVAKESNNTTAFTCVKEATKTGDFKDAHCDETHPTSEGEYEHELIPLDTTTSVETTNLSAVVLKGSLLGAKVEISCATLASPFSKIHNQEPSAGEHKFTGTVSTELTKCGVKQPLKCIIKEPIVTKADVYGVEWMEAPKAKKTRWAYSLLASLQKKPSRKSNSKIMALKNARCTGKPSQLKAA
jgi:hypothetical protein